MCRGDPRLPCDDALTGMVKPVGDITVYRTVDNGDGTVTFYGIDEAGQHLTRTTATDAIVTVAVDPRVN